MKIKSSATKEKISHTQMHSLKTQMNFSSHINASRFQGDGGCTLAGFFMLSCEVF